MPRLDSLICQVLAAFSLQLRHLRGNTGATDRVMLSIDEQHREVQHAVILLGLCILRIDIRVEVVGCRAKEAMLFMRFEEVGQVMFINRCVRERNVGAIVGVPAEPAAVTDDGAGEGALAVLTGVAFDVECFDNTIYVVWALEPLGTSVGVQLVVPHVVELTPLVLILRIQVAVNERFEVGKAELNAPVGNSDVDHGEEKFRMVGSKGVDNATTPVMSHPYCPFDVELRGEVDELGSQDFQ